MTQQYITIIDFLLLPFVFLFLYAISIYFRNKRFSVTDPVRRYFLPFIMLKAIGAVAFGVIYQFYYGYGDTFRYYQMGHFFNDILRNNPEDVIKVYFTGSTEYFVVQSYRYDFDYLFNHNPQNIIVSKFSSLIGLVTFDNYLLISIGFSILSATGIWKLFRTFSTMYPKLVQPLVICILFVPSVIFWGSGLMKDSLTIGALGWLTYGCWTFFFRKKRQLLYPIIILTSSLLLFLIKSYILLSFLPPLLFWVGSTYYSSIRNRQLKLLVFPFILVVLIVIGLALNNMITQYYNELAFEKIASTAVTIQNNIRSVEGGSDYDLGTIDPTLTGVIAKVPIAIITTLFRPFVWEINSLIMLFSALEGLCFLLFTVWILFKVGLKDFFKLIFSKGIIAFCLSFSLLFAIGVGISSGNFGTLVRYKLPETPFYLVAMLLIYYYKTGKNPLEPRTIRKRKQRLVRVAARP
jgi:hypothetical protein